MAHRCLINTKIPGVDREVGLLFGDSCPALTLTTSSYSSVCVSSPKGLSLPDPAEFSHGSVFLTTAGCQGNHLSPKLEPVFSAGKLRPYSSLYPQPPLGVTSENSAKPQARSPSSPARTFPWGPSTAERRKQSQTERTRTTEPEWPLDSIPAQPFPVLST